MRIVGVLDIQKGGVVRGVAGERAAYRPLITSLTDAVSVRTVCLAFRQQLGLRHCYIADLDAIAGNEPHWNLFEEAAQTGLALWIDAGLTSAAHAVKMASFLNGLSPSQQQPPAHRLVVGLESLPAAAVLPDLLSEIDPQQIVFSLDLRHGIPLTQIPQWREASAETIADEVLARGLQKMIVLDLADVGVNQGFGTERLLKRLILKHPCVEFIAGGGVRGPADLQKLAGVGCGGVLVASALHDGLLGPGELAAHAEF